MRISDWSSDVCSSDLDYGYHWVVGDGYYAALGVFVQMVVVFPEANAVIALNSAMDESRVLLPHLRGHFPAAFAGGGTEAADELLARRPADWRAAPPLDRKSVGQGKSVSRRGNLGGCRCSKKKK